MLQVLHIEDSGNDLYILYMYKYKYEVFAYSHVHMCIIISACLCSSEMSFPVFP